MAHRNPTFSSVLAIGPCHESLFEHFSHKQLRRLQRDIGNREFRDLVSSYVECYPIRAVDVRAGEHMALLRHRASVPGARLELPPATYQLVAREEWNPEHRHQPAWDDDDAAKGYDDGGEPQWRLGFGTLELAAGVTIVGQEGVELTGGNAYGGPEVWGAEGARFVSLHFPRSVSIPAGSSLTMEKCTFTMHQVHVEPGASLAMEDCRVFSIVSGRRPGGADMENGFGMLCFGKVEATRCTFENNADDGVCVSGRYGEAKERLAGEAKLMECVVRNNGGHGVCVGEGKATLVECVVRNNAQHGVQVRGNSQYYLGNVDIPEDGHRCEVTLTGGTVSGNKWFGFCVGWRSKVTVSAAEHTVEPPVDREQTVFHDETGTSTNGKGDWARTGPGRERTGPDRERTGPERMGEIVVLTESS